MCNRAKQCVRLYEFHKMQLKFPNAINNQRLPLHIAKMEAKGNWNHYYPVSRVYQGARMSWKKKYTWIPQTQWDIYWTNTWQEIDVRNGEIFQRWMLLTFAKSKKSWHHNWVSPSELTAKCHSSLRQVGVSNNIHPCFWLSKGFTVHLHKQGRKIRKESKTHTF